MKFIIAIILAVASFASSAQNVETKIPVTTQVQECTSKLNGTGAVVGAGAGYAAGRILGGRKSSWGIVGAATGALIGANSAAEKSCVMIDKVIGHKVIVTKQDGTIVSEKYIPVVNSK